MKTIYKYELQRDSDFSVEAPQVFKPLHIGIQDNEIYVWAEVDTSTRIVSRRFHCYATGDPSHISGEYIGSVIEQDGLYVWHFYYHPSSMRTFGA